MRNEHTPGPWTACNTGENLFQIKAEAINIAQNASAREREYFQSIASVTQRESNPTLDGGISFHTSKANAILIAAAPDLLAAVRTLLRDMQDVDASGSFGLEYQVSMDQAAKAIAKATGVQS